jgi:hypothetical protein
MHPELPERRSCERFRTDLKGWIKGDPPHRPVACTVWDISEKGVRLVFPQLTDVVPVEFELTIPSQNARAKVRLVWTDGHFYGAKFTD